MLADNVPNGPVHWAAAWPDASALLAVVGQLQQGALWLLSVHVEIGDYRLTPLETGPQRPIAVCGQGVMVFIVYPDHVNMIEPANGSVVQTLQMPPGFQWRRARFFSGRGIWHALAYDGLSARWDDIVTPGMSGAAGPRHLFLTFLDVAGCDGPIGVNVLGQLYFSSEKFVKPVAHGLLGQVRLQAVARDGHCIVVAQGNDLSKQALIEIPSGISRRVQGDAAMLVEPEVQRLARPKAMLHRLRGIRVDEAGLLTLLTAKGARLQIALDSRSSQILLRPAGAAARVGGAPLAFAPIQAPPGVGYSLAGRRVGRRQPGRARLAGHVAPEKLRRRHPRNHPGIDGRRLAGWCADGRLWGSHYFTCGQHNALPAAVYYQVLQPLLARLR